MSYSTDEKEGFIHRWSRLKQQEPSDANDEPVAQEASDALQPADNTADNMLTDADMPAIDSLDEHSNVSEFFSKKVSEELRRAALRKLFHLPVFNFTDGLNDYDEDFTQQSELLDWASRKIFSADASNENPSTDSQEVGAENSEDKPAVSAEQHSISATEPETESEIESAAHSHLAAAADNADEALETGAPEGNPKRGSEK